MILSRKYRFIFLHNPKTAGSSVTVSLSRYLGPWDLQIGIHKSSMEDGIRPNLYSCLRVLHPRVGCGLRFARRFLIHRLKYHLSPIKAYQAAFDETVKSSWCYAFGKLPIHPYAKDVRKQFSKEWKDYLKFCVVRNPWDRVVSQYHWRIRKPKRNLPSFSEWVLTEFQKRQYKGKRMHEAGLFYRVEGQLAVDSVVKFENLPNDLQAVCRQVGLDWDGWLPTKKGNFRNNRDYREWYDHKTRRCIEEFYQQDIEEFGYDF